MTGTTPTDSGSPVGAFGRFLASGGFNTAATYGLYLILLRVLGYRASYTISFLAGIVLAYELNRKFVFRARRSAKSMAATPLIYLVQYLLGLAIVSAVVGHFGLKAELAPMVSIVLTLPVTFFLTRMAFATGQADPVLKEPLRSVVLEQGSMMENPAAIPAETSMNSNSNPEAPAWLGHWPLLLLAIVYALINFVLTKNTLSPVHQDDYLALGYGFENMRWAISRPVSTNLVYLMGAGGPFFAFGLMNVATVLVPYLVLRFHERLFSTRLGWPLVVLFGAISYSHMSAFEHGKFLGLITNLTSHFFGCLTLLLLFDAWRLRRSAPAIAAGLAYALSTFAKEDFLLPPLLLLAYFWLERILDLRASGKTVRWFNGWWTVLTSVMVAVAAASVVFNFWLSNNPFVSGLAGSLPAQESYAVNLKPASVIASFYKLTIGYVWLPTVLASAAFLASAIWLPQFRLRLCLMAVLIASLIFPYALIPNNMPDFRAFVWLPWFAGITCVALIALIAKWNSPRLFLRAAAAIVVPLAVSLVVYRQAYSQRQAVAGWYAAQQALNIAIVTTLSKQRSSIAREDVVGIVGVDGLSPWSNTDAEYLHKKLNFDNRWIIFVAGGSMFYQLDPIVNGKPTPAKKFVGVQKLDSLCSMGDILLLKFDASGVGTPTRSKDYCASVH